MSGEEDAVHVPDLTLVPVGTVEDGDSRGNGGGLVGVGLDADALLVGDREEVVDDLGLLEPRTPNIAWHLVSSCPRICLITHLEAVLAGGVVDGSDVRDLLELALRVVTEEGEDGDDGLGGDVENELVLVDGELLDVLGQASGDVLAVLVQGRDLGGGVVGGVDADGLLEGRGRGLVGGRCGRSVRVRDMVIQSTTGNNRAEMLRRLIVGSTYPGRGRPRCGDRGQRRSGRGGRHGGLRGELRARTGQPW